MTGSKKVEASRLGSRRFSPADQKAFALLSGDWNPIHMDEVAARRTLFGGCVAHGLHSLLWALDCLDSIRSLQSIEAQFNRPIPLGEEIECRVRECTGDAFDLLIVRGGAPCARVRGEFAAEEFSGEVGSSAMATRAVRDLTFEEALAAKGSVPVGVDSSASAVLFPKLAARLPQWQLAQLLATTRIVGMECPGFHSLFGGLKISFRRPEGAANLRYATIRGSKHYGSLEIELDGYGIMGTLKTFYLTRWQPQASFSVCRQVVRSGEFSPMHALVVGGSRGLGEVAAKLIAAGGGAVCLSYFKGQEDAESLCREITIGGGDAQAVSLDVRQHVVPVLPWRPTHLFYFATPPITLSRDGRFSDEDFQRFCQYFVAGFHRIVTALPRPLTIFYPSTVYLDEGGEQAIEYVSAKAAGEQVCRHVATYAGCNSFVVRIPRTRTDQTTGLQNEELQEALPLMLDLLRATVVFDAAGGPGRFSLQGLSIVAPRQANGV